MDDTQLKTQNPNAGQQVQGDDSGQAPHQTGAGQARMTTPPTVQQPVQPVGGAKKEAIVGTPVTEWVSSSTPEIVLPQEVKDVGIEVQPTMPIVLPSAQQAGVQHAKEATPVTPITAQPLGITTPRSVLNQLKTAHKSWKDAMSWLVRLVIKEQEKEKNHPTESRYN